MTDKPIQDAAASAPHPDEDDLDDLDDVLDSFQEAKISDQKPTPAASASTTIAPNASGPGRPKISHDAGSEEEFAAQLQAGMSNLISELGENPEMQAEFEKMMQKLVAAGAASSDQKAGEHLRAAAEAAPKSPERKAKESAKKSAGKGGAEDFNDTIRKTMERMQASDSTAKQSTTSQSNMSEEDILAQMMRELTEGGGEGGEEGFNAMLMNMMAHLTNKEILYEPMKELHDKFPEWTTKNEGKTPKDEMERYKEQQKLVGEIVARFERKEYSDDNEDDREYIVERMQKMQAAGSPPSDLVGDMSAAQEALGDLEGGCPTQ
ncbi:hypothetical protein AC579_2891 [Pseudocercospora musae]|uniref:Pex19-domain-containing protein n=1 Tax=Pseudocercospora musae TaxID=113226 RepID=A0A139IUB1_9PEZI|nr:hypothetical protein AC579_2891 [Pseudocercospora musae]